MEKYLQILRQCPLFAEIAPEDLPAMLVCLGGRIVSYNEGNTIFAEGDPVCEIGILLSGAAQVQQTDYFGNRSILALLGPGELFGESFACAAAEHFPLDVVALERTEVLFIPMDKLASPCEKACAFHQQIIYNLMRILAQKNLAFQQKVQITGKRSTRDKLLTYLQLCAKRAGSNSFEIPYDRQALADYLGVERSGLSAEISKLRAEGCLASHKRHFELKVF